MGLKWQVVNGRQIRITDNWIPKSHNPLAFNPATIRSSIQLVTDLLHPQEGWQHPLLRTLFPDHLLPNILSIYLPCESQANVDTLYWSLDPLGKYIVRSGYHQATNINVHSTTTPSTSQGGQLIPPAIWKKLWNAALPEKIKIFFWRVLLRACPTMQALATRSIVSAGVCLRCEEESESAAHMLLECPRSQTIWHCSPFGFDFSGTTKMTFEVWFVDWTLKAPSKDLCCSSMFLLWEIWKDRNAVIYGDLSLPAPDQIVQFEGTATSVLLTTWLHLPVLCFRRTVEDNTFIATGSWTLKSHDGQTIFSGTSSYMAMSPLQTKAMACLLALRSVDLDYHPCLRFYTDCLVLSKILQNQFEVPLEIRFLVNDIRNIMRRFSLVLVLHVPRAQAIMVSASNFVSQSA
ncbi:OLC1v1017199C1 [Oldenlandia corymbosa var. corymbosa]|uniref:OLC1v1017199C1 n=1 Tax=Oldenlandia corymbosa var. corymbosa TaxID=529605 RepID=A0AAV1E8Y7_OLDCO|nr:OLC1v1017199C1 [Oldenlandia corymbosa var. corymbosa]